MDGSGANTMFDYFSSKVYALLGQLWYIAAKMQFSRGPPLTLG